MQFKSLILTLLTLLAPLTATAQAPQTKPSAQVAGKSLVVTWDVVMDHLQLRPNQTIVYTPVVEDQQGNTQTLRPVMLTGRKQHYVYLRNGSKNYPDAIEIQRKNGTTQRYAYRQAIQLEPWMNNASLRIATDTCGCGNLAGQSHGDAIDINPHWADKCALAFATPNVAGDDPVLSLSGRAYLDFPVNRTELHPDYHNNAAELHKIMSSIDTVRNNKNVDLTSISIHGYASPEGPWDNNVRLAQGRAATLTAYVKSQYNFPASTYHVASTPEDWAGLDSFLVKSNLAEKEEILRIVRSTDMEPDPKDHYIRDHFPEAYRTILAAYYPYLRHSDYEVKYKIRPMSDEEAAKLISTEPRLLSLAKMYRIAKLYEKGSDSYNEVILTAANVYPSNEEANVNAANVALRSGDTALAKTYLRRAGTGAAAQNARGIIQLIEGNYDEAQQLFTSAAAAGCQEAKQNLELMK